MSGEYETWKPWSLLASRGGDGWKKPENADDKDCHLMVQLMETWLIADRETLANYYGQGFNVNALSNRNEIELIPKDDNIKCLEFFSKYGVFIKQNFFVDFMFSFSCRSNAHFEVSLFLTIIE